MLSAPIFHVNGDDPEAVVHASRIAIEFRQKFRKDVEIDMFCYRRHGHNEGDEPMFTQPLMYKKIAKQKTTREKYADKLIAENVLLESEVDEVTANFKQDLEDAFEAANTYKLNKADYLEGAWSGMKVASGGPRRGATAITKELFDQVGDRITTVPDGFDLNSKIGRLMKAKKAMFAGDQPFDWATAEALAFGSLLVDGYDVRLSGQDCGRGTFSQRHATLYDQTTNKKYFPLAHIDDEQARFEVHDSPLSEAAVLGFEYGYTLAEPRALVLWEAQFGDVGLRANAYQRTQW